jgi:hypothetical protein
MIAVLGPRAENMSIDYYEKIGGIIYGTGRLNFVLTMLSRWFAKENGDQMESDNDEIDPSAAIRFFQKKPTFSTCKLDYLRIFEAFTLLRQVREDIAKKTAAEIDVHLAEIKELHYALAQFMDDIGYQGVSSTFLRRWDDPV